MSNYRKLPLTTVQALLLCVPLGGPASAAHVANAQEHLSMVVRGDEVEWKPGPQILNRVQMAVLKGDPTEAGPFVMRLKFPAFFDFPVHRDPGTEGDVTVLSGAMGMALGETFDRYVARPLPAGSYFVVPDTWYFAWTFEETVVEVHGNGPWHVEFFEP